MLFRRFGLVIVAITFTAIGFGQLLEQRRPDYAGTLVQQRLEQWKKLEADQPCALSKKLCPVSKSDV